MRITNTTAGDITINYRNGVAVTIPAGKYVVRPSSDLDYLDDTKVTLALFASGALVLANDDGSAWSGSALPSVPASPAGPQPLMVTSSAQGIVKAGIGTSAAYLKSIPAASALSVAVAKALAGVADASINVIGDSTTLGARSGPALSDLRKHSIAVRMAEALDAAMPVPVRHASFFGDTGVSTAYLTFDPRWGAMGSGWSQSTYMSVGGRMWRSVSTSTGKLTFTPGIEWDTVDVYFMGGSGYGSATLDVGGAIVTTLDFSVTHATINKLTAGPAEGFALANQTLNIGRASAVAKELFIVGAEFRNSTKPAVNVRLIAAGGTASSFWAGKAATYSPGNALKTVAADLNIINLGINDWLAQVTTADFVANMNVIRNEILAGKPTAQFLLIKQPAMSDPDEDQARITSGIDLLAASWGCDVLDLRDLWPKTWAESNSLGLMADPHHPNAQGYADIGRKLGQYLL